MFTMNEVKERYQGLQSLCKVINTDGCFFITLCTVAEEFNESPIDFIGTIRKSQKERWIDYEFNIYQEGVPLLEYLTGAKWSRRKVTTLPPTIKSNEYTVAHWVSERNPNGHYRRRYVDSINNSKTVAEGYVDFYYIYTVS